MAKALTHKQLIVRAGTDPRAQETAVGRALREAAKQARQRAAKGGRS
jgi:hypothetical protein